VVVVPLAVAPVAVGVPLGAVANQKTLRALVYRPGVESKNTGSVSLSYRPIEDR